MNIQLKISQTNYQGSKESETSKYSGEILSKIQQYYRQKLQRETPEMRGRLSKAMQI